MHIYNFFKEVNHLSTFRKAMMGTNLDLDDMYNQTEHMYSKLRKMMLTKRSLISTYADALNKATPQTSAPHYK